MPPDQVPDNATYFDATFAEDVEPLPEHLVARLDWDALDEPSFTAAEEAELDAAIAERLAACRAALRRHLGVGWDPTDR